ncbi:hypothetical protein M2360_003621 [Rhizobium sp. SG_E_25_P2]|uniref:Qat anti-phage system associated protein QatB n=1 Tax=Rhizobium sp. SG_E_25_P2 TaxID=2879942 RepID=UPI00247C81E6|nr:hypothetical protein [Rhizobium sp. SG_E_25_P2]
MGTSGKNPGSRRGLVPTWVESPPPGAPSAPQPKSPQPPSPGAPGNPNSPPLKPTAPAPRPASPRPALPPATAGESLSSARGDFTRGVSSGGGGGGGGRGIRRGAGKFVRAVGGAKAATRAMGPSVRTASGLGTLASEFAQQGAAEALRPFNLEGLAGAPAVDVFVALTDVLCQDGGTIDEAIARDAMLQTIADISAQIDVPFDALPAPVLEAVFLGTISRSIETKIFSELGANALRFPTDPTAVRRIEATLQDFVHGSVRDAFTTQGQSVAALPPAEIERFVTSIYQRTFELLQAFEDEE